jgi:flagellar basal-body rod protein FlgC
MNFINALRIGASGLSAQRLRMNVTSSNLANINTTRTPGGGPYRRKDVVFYGQSRLTHHLRRF